MTRFMNTLALIAFAAALTPVAANATTMTPLNHVQVEVHKAVAGPLPMIQRIVDYFDAVPAQTLLNQTIVHSGATAQMFPVADGG